MTKTLILVDGNSLLHRAFHATPPLTTSKGELTNAVLAFSRMLFRALAMHHPDYAAVAFDRAAPTFRHVAFDAYKAHRPSAPEGLFEQLGRIREIVTALNLPIYELDGFEADDVLGTLARQAEETGLDVIIVSGDSDALQLVTPHIRVLTPRKGMSDTVLYDVDAVRQRYGLEPRQLIDYKALKGDPSDNVPGLPGIGEKTAAKLLTQFGSVDGLLERRAELDPKIRQIVEANAEGLRRDHNLVTIVTNAPVQLDLSTGQVGYYDRRQLSALMSELEFRLPTDEMPPVRGSATSRQLSLLDSRDATSSEEAAEPAPVNSAAEASAATSSLRYQVVASLEDLALVAKQLEAAPRFSVDVETTDTDPMRARLVGISLSIEPGQAWYVPVGHLIGPSLPIQEVLAILRPVLADAGRGKIGHNLKYDASVFARAGVEVKGLAFDTMVAKYLLQSSERALNLKDVVFFELGVQMTPITELIGKGKNQISMADVPVTAAAEYACADADMTLRLENHLAPQLVRNELRALFDDLEMPLIDVLASMEREGVAIDVPYLKEMSGTLAEQIGTLEAEIHQTAGHHFNVNSTRQLATVLFDELKLPSSRKTTTGFSTDADTLEELRSAHPVVALILDYRQLVKLKSTYVDALPLMVNVHTGRVHTSFNQTGASTGRLSSSDPNLQNIPIRTELGRQVRRAFIARSPEYRLVSADYSQIELRILAHVTRDPNLVAAFETGQDIHTLTASQVLGVPLDAVDSSQRRMAKTINFGIIYGMSDYGLATQLQISRREAGTFIQSYFARYPGVREYLEQTKLTAANQGYVSTLLGRRRYIPEINTPNRQIRNAAERMAINMPIQGTAADIIKRAMIQIHQLLPERGFKARMILQVHDELVFDAPADEVEALAPLVAETMEQALPMSVPLKVDVTVGSNWYDQS